MIRPSQMIAPWMRLSTAKVIGGVMQAPVLGVIAKPLPNSLIPDFSVAMTGRNTPVRELAAFLRTLLRTSPQVYQARYAAAVRPIVSAALDLHNQAYGLDPTKWSDDAHRVVYKTNFLPPEGGHGNAVVTLQPVKNASQRILDPRFMRMLLGSFPARFASVSDGQFAQLVASGRDQTGVPIDRWNELEPAILDRNAQLMRDGAMFEGMHAIGPSSFVHADGHYIQQLPEGRAMQCLLMATSARHNQDGILPWSPHFEPSFSSGITGLSMHLGHSQTPIADMANDAMIAGLNRTNYSVAGYLADAYDGLVEQYGEEQAARLLLDPEVRHAVLTELLGSDWRTVYNRAFYATLDTSLGSAAAAMRAFAPETISLLETEKYLASNTRAEVEALVQAGIDTAIKEGYTGPGGMETLAGAVLPLTDGTLAGEAIPDPQLAAFNPEAPLPEQLQAAYDTVRASANDLPWEFIRDQVANQTAALSEQALALLPDAGKLPLEELIGKINTAELQAGVKRTLDSVMQELAASTPELDSVRQSLGEQGAAGIVNLALTQTTGKQMTNAEGGESWLGAKVAQTVSAARQQALQVQAGKVQAELVSATNARQATGSEVRATTGALEELAERIGKDPANPDLKAEQAELERQLDAQKEQDQEAERSEDSAKQQDEQIEREQRETQEREAAASAREQARAHEVFSGE